VSKRSPVVKIGEVTGRHAVSSRPDEADNQRLLAGVPLLIAACLAFAALAAAPAALARPSLTTTINVIAGKPSEFHYKLSSSTAKRGIIVFKLTIGGALPHDFKFCSKASSSLANSCTGRGTAAISPGGSATLRVSVLLKGTYEYLCTIPGHAAAGMKGFIKVT
jgi:uncharacterized cupredoxin-like copper-binding protein